MSGVTGAAAGALPHVLHHVGLFAGAALVTGLVGGIVFALVGLAAMTPLILRLHRRTGSWRLPLLAVATFAIMFTLMTTLMGTM